MQAMQGDWLPARAALHATGLYFSLREIRPSELQDPFMQETIARIPARESVVQIAREDLGQGTAGTSPGRHHLPRLALRLDARLATAQAACRRRRLRRAAAGQRDPAAAAQVVATGSRRRAALARRRICGPCAQALRAEAHELEHALCRPRRRGVPDHALGPVPARSRRSRRYRCLASPPAGYGTASVPARRSQKCDRSRWRLALARGIRRAALRRVLRSGGPPRSRARHGWWITDRLPAAVWEAVAPHFGLADRCDAARAHAGDRHHELEGADRAAGEVRGRRRGQASRGERRTAARNRSPRPAGPEPAQCPLRWRTRMRIAALALVRPVACRPVVRMPKHPPPKARRPSS